MKGTALLAACLMIREGPYLLERRESKSKSTNTDAECRCSQERLAVPTFRLLAPGQLQYFRSQVATSAGVSPGEPGELEVWPLVCDRGSSCAEALVSAWEAVPTWEEASLNSLQSNVVISRSRHDDHQAANMPAQAAPNLQA